MDDLDFYQRFPQRQRPAEAVAAGRIAAAFAKAERLHLLVEQEKLEHEIATGFGGFAGAA